MVSKLLQQYWKISCSVHAQAFRSFTLQLRIWIPECILLLDLSVQWHRNKEPTPLYSLFSEMFKSIIYTITPLIVLNYLFVRISQCQCFIYLYFQIIRDKIKEEGKEGREGGVEGKKNKGMTDIEIQGRINDRNKKAGKNKWMNWELNDYFRKVARRIYFNFVFNLRGCFISELPLKEQA